jgi:hypothetical protein
MTTIKYPKAMFDHVTIWVSPAGEIRYYLVMVTRNGEPFHIELDEETAQVTSLALSSAQVATHNPQLCQGIAASHKNAKIRFSEGSVARLTTRFIGNTTTTPKPNTAQSGASFFQSPTQTPENGNNAGKPRAVAANELGSAMMCNHANEVPVVCPCEPGCYCRTQGSCRPRNLLVPSNPIVSTRGSVTGKPADARWSGLLCSLCGERQFEAEGPATGKVFVSCKNGHGGAPGKQQIVRKRLEPEKPTAGERADAFFGETRKKRNSFKN